MQESVHRALDYLAFAGIITLKQLLIVFGISMLLALVMQKLNVVLMNQSVRLVGTKAYIILIAWIGVPVHELGHAVFALLFGHRITRLVLFKPGAADGSWGCVDHTYNSRNLYHRIGNFFIGIGPIILGSTLIYLLARYLLDLNLQELMRGSRTVDYNGGIASLLRVSIHNVVSIAVAVIRNITFNLFGLEWRYLLFLYLSFSIGNYVNLSTADIKHLAPGFITLLICLIVFNLATVWMGSFSIGWLQQNQIYIALFHVILLLGMGLCFGFLLVIVLLNKLIGR